MRHPHAPTEQAPSNTSLSYEWTIRDGFRTPRTTSVGPWRSCPAPSPGECALIALTANAPTAAAADPLRGRQPGRPVRHRHQRSPTRSGLRDQPRHSTATPPTPRCPEPSVRAQAHRRASRNSHTSVSGRRTDGEAVRRSWNQPDHPAPGTHQDRHPASPTRQTISHPRHVASRCFSLSIDHRTAGVAAP